MNPDDEVAPGWYPHPERPEEMRYWDGEAWRENRWATNLEAPERRAFQQDPGGFVRDLAAIVVFLGLLVFALWAGNAWAGLEIWEVLDLPGMICLAIVIVGGVLWWWLRKEDS